MRHWFKHNGERMGTAVSDGIVALAGVVGTVCRDTADLLVIRDLAEEVGQDRRIADVAPGDLNGPNLQRFLSASPSIA